MPTKKRTHPVLVAAIVLLLLGSSPLLIPWLNTATANPPTTGCREHIELLSAAAVAKEYNTTEQQIVANHRINLWAGSGQKGRAAAVGKLLPGSRALIVDQQGDDYKVMSPFDKSIGWVNSVQISHTLWQDVETRKGCQAPK